MHASAVRAIFGPLLPVLSFVTDHAHQYFYRTCQFYGSQLSVFFPVNLEIIVWNVTSYRPNKLRCAIAKFELKSYIMPISYT